MTSQTTTVTPASTDSRAKPPPSGLRGLVAAHQMTAFVVLSLILSWIPWALGGFSGGDINPAGPAMAAAIVLGVSCGGQLRAFGRRLTHVTVSPGWLLAALVVPIVLVGAAVIVNSSFGAPLPTAGQLGGWTALPVEFVLVFLLIGLGEEIGWTAFGAPRALIRWHLPFAVAALGAIRVVWHLPLFLSGDQPWVIAVGIVAFQFLVLWAYRRSGQWVVSALFHAMVNTVGPTFLFQFVDGPDNARLGVLMVTNYVLLVLVIVAWDRRSARRAISTAARP